MVQPFLQSVISATADAVSVNFTETVALTDTNSGSLYYFRRFDAPIDTALTGPAGSTGQSPIRLNISGRGLPIPNVNVRILSPEVTLPSGQVVVDPNLPSASCVTAPGADPGSVLTDASGNATCYPVFGPGAGNGVVIVLVGGLDPIQIDQSTSPLPPMPGPVAFDQINNIQLIVTQVTPGRVNIVEGNNQTVNPGQASSPLIVQVTDAAGNVTIANQDVAWTVSGLATLSTTASKTDSVGKAQTIATFSPNASGQVTVRAALTGSNNGIAATFVLSTRVLIGSLTKVSGDLQTAQSGQNFPADLIVQVVGTNGQPLSNQPIGFAVTGGDATLSALSSLTDAAGQARVTVTAGSTAGTVTVTAFVATFSTSFSLTVIPPGPALSSGSFYNAGGGGRLGALSPCSLVTVIATGIAPNVEGLVFNTNSFGPWATTLASDTVKVNGFAAPIYSVGKVNGAEQLTFQVPCEVSLTNAAPVTVSVAGGSATVSLPVRGATPGIFETVMSDGVNRAVAIRPDGSFVSLLNPARPGDIIRVMVTGMGPTAPPTGTGAFPFAGIDSLILGQVIVGVNNAGARVIASRAAPSLIGVYEVAFEVPTDSPTGNNIVLSVAVNVPGEGQTRFSNGSKLPVQQ